MAKKSAAGSGSIRKRTLNKNGKQYTYWEARYSAGYDPGTGKQIQRTITGKTQKEVSQKLKTITASIDDGTYMEPSKMTVGEWLDIWAVEYLCNVKPRTVDSYLTTINHRIKPGLGATRLDQLTPHTIQSFYNSLGEDNDEKGALCPKSVKNVHGILHRALKQAVLNGYIRYNPTEACILPRIVKKDIMPLDEADTKLFLEAIKGDPFELLFTVTLFTGLRKGEVLGLTWNCVDFLRGTILVEKQLQQEKKKKGKYYLATLKNDKPRSVTPAPWVMQILRKQKLKQAEDRIAAGSAWSNPDNLVFTNPLGGHLVPWTVSRHYKEIVASIGRPDARFHDLRHSYAVAAIRSGDDIKTVQGNLGHATASFTLDVYGHVTDQMKNASAARMEAYIKDILSA